MKSFYPSNEVRSFLVLATLEQYDEYFSKAQKIKRLLNKPLFLHIPAMERLVDIVKLFIGHVGVNLGSGYVFMP